MWLFGSWDQFVILLAQILTIFDLLNHNFDKNLGNVWIYQNLGLKSWIIDFFLCVCFNADQPVLSAVLAIIGRFCVNITFNIGLQYGAELIPTEVRAQGISTVHIAGYVASIVSPYIVDLVTKETDKIYKRIELNEFIMI